MKKVCIYARVSTKDQDCSRQLEELREIVKNHNYELVDEYVDEGISGSVKHRAELDRMLKDALSRKFVMIMTLELSRLGRSVSNMCEIVELLKAKKIDLFVKNQNVDTSTIVGEFFFNIMNAVSQYEKDLIRERIISGMHSAKNKNKQIGRKTNLTENIKSEILNKRKAGVGINRLASDFKVSARKLRQFFQEQTV